MKRRVLTCVALVVISLSSIAHAGLIGGGISGPLQVYDPKVIAQTLEIMQHNAAMLLLEQRNLAQMDAATAAANMDRIQQNLADLVTLQMQMESLITDYNNFQAAWDATYGDYQDAAGMRGEDYAYRAAQIAKATDKAVYDAMRAQGFGVSGQITAAQNLENLLNQSQNAQGALAAAQAGNQIAGQQVEQLLLLQQMMAQTNNAQMAYQKQKLEQDRDAEKAAQQAFSGEVVLQKSAGPGAVR